MELEEKSLYTALKNGFLTTMAAPFFTIILMFVVALLLVLSFVLILPLILGLPGIVPILGFRGMFDRLVAFGLREREKTPREIEMEEVERVYVPEFKRNVENKPSFRDSRAGTGSTAGEDVADGEGQVEQKE
jgi:hypothetical protein